MSEKLEEFLEKQINLQETMINKFESHAAKVRKRLDVIIRLTAANACVGFGSSKLSEKHDRFIDIVLNQYDDDYWGDLPDNEKNDDMMKMFIKE